MIRPYLAILKDSYREALASRVLAILLIIITIVLLLLAPVGLRDKQATRLNRSSVRNWPNLANKIQSQAAAEGPSVGKVVFSRFGEPVKKQLAEAAEQSAGEMSGDTISAFVKDLNQVIEGPSLYEPTAFADVKLSEEAQELVDQGAKRNEIATARLNRLLLESAWPSEFQKEDGETRLVYLWIESDPLPLPRAQLLQIVRLILTVIVDWSVGVLGVFAAILVTSSIIPQTFEAGAIDLLLSKPVSRVLLYLTKFFGGCAFIGLIAAYVIAGLWLIAGTRFGIWSHSLFLCIPIMLFLFAIYYGVSALAGLIWRNAIVSVVLTIIFWGLCFSIGSGKGVCEKVFIDKSRVVKLVFAGQTLLGADDSGDVYEWQPQDRKWYKVFAPEETNNPVPFGPPPGLIGPVYDMKRDRILAATPGPVTPGSGGFNMFPPAAPLVVGARQAAWNRKKIGTAPLGTLAFFVRPDGALLAVTKGAVFRLTEKAGGKTGAPQEEFVRMGPEAPLLLDPNASVAMNAETGALAAFNRGTVLVLAPDASGKYVRQIEKEVVPAKESKSAVLAFAGQTILVALSDGRVLVLGASDLALKQEFRPVGDQAPRFAAASPGNRWISVLFHNRRLWVFDVEKGVPAKLAISGQGDISAMAFEGPQRLVAIDRGTRISQYDLESGRLAEQSGPELDKLLMAYYYVLNPIYTVLPKPGKMGDVVAYLLSDLNELQEMGQGPRDLSQRREKIEVAQPILSSLAFLVVILALGCVYVWRTDF